MDYAKKIPDRQIDRLCIIRTNDGMKMELRGSDAPSPNAVLLFFKKRKLKALQERNRSSNPQDRRQRMLDDLRRRSASIAPPAPSPNRRPLFLNSLLV